MAITMFVPGFKTSKTDERHGDGMVIHSDTGHTLVIDGFDGGAPTTALVKYLKQHNYKDLYLLLSHPHYDHYKGLKVIMADSFFNIKMFFCYDPDTIKHGIGSSANGRSVKDDYDNLNSCISQARGKGAKIDYLAKGRQVILGDIEFKVWRKQPTHFTELDDGNAYAFTNDGSLCCYFPKLRFLTTGDGPNELKEAIAYFGDKVYILKVPHHGNSCSMSNAQAARKAGCVIAYETNIETKGPGTTGFTAYGARRLVEQGVKVLMQDTDLIMTATAGKLTVRQGGKTWTFDVPYDGKRQSRKCLCSVRLEREGDLSEIRTEGSVPCPSEEGNGDPERARSRLWQGGQEMPCRSFHHRRSKEWLGETQERSRMDHAE